MRWLLFMGLLAACGGEDTKDTGTGTVTDGDADTDADSDTDTVTSTAACNTDHEDCAPGEPGCGGDGGTMLPGADCTACHSAGNFGENEPEAYWSAAGTAYVDVDGSGPLSGAIVRVTDSAGTTVELTTNSAGNFYTNDTLIPPISAEIEVDGNVTEMFTQPATAACNSCHRCDGEAGGKLFGI